MKGCFEIATGSVTGRDHILTGKNNQDAVAVWQQTLGTIVVVCDGCGSSPHSEVGAKLGARLLVSIITRFLSEHPPETIATVDTWQFIQKEMLSQFQSIIQIMGGHWAQTIRDYWLFTIVGTVITPLETVLFSLGDGVIILNGQVQALKAFPGNAPPYLTYGLLSPEALRSPESNLGTQEFDLKTLPTDQVESILIGTDGVKDLMQSAQRPLPGRTELVGEISQFWQDDRYFTNPDQVRRRLFLSNREAIQPDWQRSQLNKAVGLLPDDTTLVVIRRSYLAGG